MRGWSFDRELPELVNDIRVPSWACDFFDKLPVASRPPFHWIFMGPANTSTPLHVDPLLTHAWLAQVRVSRQAQINLIVLCRSTAENLLPFSRLETSHFFWIRRGMLIARTVVFLRSVQVYKCFCLFLKTLHSRFADLLSTDTARFPLLSKVSDQHLSHTCVHRICQHCFSCRPHHSKFCCSPETFFSCRASGLTGHCEFSVTTIRKYRLIPQQCSGA